MCGLGHAVAAPACVVIVGARRPGDAEVGQIRVARRVEQDVRRLDVAMDDAGGVRRQQRRADLLDEAAHACDVERAAAHERGLCRAAGEHAEHEVCAAGLAPVVVERHDVGVLEPGDELCLGLEPLHEAAVVGEVGPDHLDRDIAIRAGLRRRQHAAERAFTDDRVHGVAAKRSRPTGGRRRCLPDGDRSLERLEVGRRLEPGLVAQDGSVGLVLAQRVGLPAGGEQRLHEQRHGSLAERVGRPHPVQIRDRPLVLTQRHHHLGALLDSHQPHLVQTVGLGEQPPLVRPAPRRRHRATAQGPPRTSPSPAPVPRTLPSTGRPRTRRHPASNRRGRAGSRRALARSHPRRAPTADVTRTSCTERAAPSGAAPSPQRQSTMRVVDTAWPGRCSNRASIRRCCGPPIATTSPSTLTSTGPSTP